MGSPLPTPDEPAAIAPAVPRSRQRDRRDRRWIAALATTSALTLGALGAAWWSGAHAGLSQDDRLEELHVFVKTPKGFSNDAQFTVRERWALRARGERDARPSELSLAVGSEPTLEQKGFDRWGGELPVHERRDDEGARRLFHEAPRFEAKGAPIELAFTQPVSHRYGWGRHWITTPWLVGTGARPLETSVLVADGVDAPGFECEDRRSTGKRCTRETRDGRPVLVPAGPQPDDFTFLGSVLFFFGLLTYGGARRGYLDTLVREGVIDPAEVASRWAPFTYRVRFTSGAPGTPVLPSEVRRVWLLRLGLGLLVSLVAIVEFVALAGGISPLPLPFVTSVFSILVGLVMTQWFASTRARPAPAVAVVIAPLAMALGGSLVWLGVGALPLLGALLVPRPRATGLDADAPSSRRIPEIEPPRA